LYSDCITLCIFSSRELLVDGCPGVTDTVVEVFCNGQSALHKLSVVFTEVTPIGIQCAIQHLPELEELNCSNQSYNLMKAFRRIPIETGESKKYSLTKLKMEIMIHSTDHTRVPYKKGIVSLMVDMCPLVVDLSVDLYDKGFTNEELLGEKNLK
jgi:hypothetical protein